MEVNREESLRALEMGNTYADKGDWKKAAKFYGISYRLHPEESTKRKLRTAETLSMASSSRNGSASVNGNTTSSTPKHTSDQESEVIRVLKAKTYYEKLSVLRTASQADIKKAFHRTARKIHPDKNPHPRADEAFKSLSEANDILSDEEKRRKYDLYGDSLEPQHMSAPNMFHRASHYRGGGGFARATAEEQIFRHFNTMFGNENLFRNAQRQTRGRGAQQNRGEAGTTRVPSLLFLLLNILPIILFVLPTLFSMFEDQPIYSLHRTQEFNQERITMNGKVPYFTASNFDKRVAETAGLTVFGIERSVERDWLQWMQAQCAKEQQRKKQLLQQSRGFFTRAQEKEYYKKTAQEMEMPGCDAVRRYRVEVGV